MTISIYFQGEVAAGKARRHFTLIQKIVSFRAQRGIFVAIEIASLRSQ